MNYSGDSSAETSDVCGDNLTWTLDEKGTLTISGTGDMYDRPSGISEPLFTPMHLVRTVVICDGVTSIGDYAFFGYPYLSEVTIPNSVKSIGDYAFFQCEALTNITIPSSVTSIGDQVFTLCSTLTGITVSESNPSYSSDNGVLFDKGKEELIHYPVGNGRTSYAIPNTVTLIGEFAFRECKYLTDITIPDSVKTIGTKAFQGCIGLKGITIPDSVTSVGDGAFQSCYHLVNVTIPNSLKSISKYMFSNCSYLVSVTIPDSVETIGESAFFRCSELRQVTIGNSVETIEKYAFEGCTNLTNITIPDSVETIGESAFSECKSLTNTTIPDSVETIGEYAFNYCESMTKITIPDSVKNIGGSAFRNCESVTEITIGSSVTSIGNGAFLYCDNIREVVNYSSLNIVAGKTDYENIGRNAYFVHTPSSERPYTKVQSNYLTASQVTIPDSVTSIGNSVFLNCKSLESVTIPDSVTSIGENAFSGCTSLTGIVIPSSMTSIGYAAFSECTSLTGITVSESNPSYSSDGGVLFDKDKDALIQYPVGNDSKSYVIPDSVTSIEDFAFYGCTSITSITFPDSVSSVGYAAFYGCTFCDTAGNEICQDADCLKGRHFHGSDCDKLTMADTDDIIIDEAVDPTCTETGNTTGKHCSECGVIISEKKILPALGHVKGTHHEASDSTCTSAGNVEYWDCGNGCGSHLNGSLDIMGDVVVKPLGHDTTDHAAKAATCTEKGWSVYQTCSRCDYSTYKEIPALGHTVVVDKAIPATKTSVGHSAGTHCSVCDTILSGNEEIPMLPSEATKTEVSVSEGSAIMDKDSVQAVIDEGLSLEIRDSDLSIDIPNSVLSNVISGKEGDVSLDVAEVSAGDLGEAQKDAVKDADLIISIDLSVGGTAIHELGDDVIVTVNYTPLSGKDTSKMYVAYVKDDGTIEKIDCSYADGKVTFTTDHFSFYAIMYDDPESESGFPTVYLVIGVIAALVLVGGAIAVVRRHG
ncbi:leucine-rich repeat domain-containing protein [Methanomethylophilus alvi]|uniref:leucine-rich repeat domain-containing protein n=1 Tax=Methanomethylophilus alvi TaxID=1291540 RepID=UPI0037DC8E5E